MTQDGKMWMEQAFPGYTRPKLSTTIRKARHRSGATLRELADRVGIDFTYLSKIENGHEVSVSEPTIRRLADALGLAEEADALVFMSGKIPARVRCVMLECDPYDAARLFRADGIEVIATDLVGARARSSRLASGFRCLAEKYDRMVEAEYGSGQGDGIEAHAESCGLLPNDLDNAEVGP